MVTYLSIVIGHLLTGLAIAAGVLYAGMVLMTYRTDGPRNRLSFEFRDPVRSAEHLVVWLGVMALDACLRFARAILNMLLEASAEVGEWFISRSLTMQESVRSRFLV
jgi:hypothetical protein